ncbi:Glycosyl transferase family 2 [Moraxella caprae]|uniref:Glycosyl transferase family 2 n=1 Tax=Moraxella caprae TaxID=90240 RepID=A0A378R4L8_9GAMM|nr:glycosyltransferase [Moraxella caprae]STZ08830.1 Glycosyl transferase family 2 [Moraxella caprae]
MDNVTLCLTIGKRPNELAQTLDSLLSKIHFEHIIAINDFSDEATNQVFKEKCPQGQLISLGYNLGHHKAVDYMYSQVNTSYIFHCEDDWFFDSTPDIQSAMSVLKNHTQISAISFRQFTDFLYTDDERNAVKLLEDDLADYVRVEHLHEQWHGYSFNPHLAKKSLWQTYQPFAQFKKERHISRHLRQQGLYMLFLKQGNCYHIGHDSVSNPPKSFWQKLKFW